MLDLIRYLGERCKEPGSYRGLMGSLLAIGITIPPGTAQWIVLGGSIFCGLVSFLVAERDTVAASGKPLTIDSLMLQVAADTIARGPQFAAVAKTLLGMHAAGNMSADDVRAVLGTLTGVPSVVPAKPLGDAAGRVYTEGPTNPNASPVQPVAAPADGRPPSI